ncbi:hypothetical protein ACFW04_013408 [Cataglyphis niger]
METTDIIEQVQLLAKCYISKKDLTDKFVKLLGQHEISDEVEYYVEEDQEDITCENMPSTIPPEKISMHETVPYDIKLKIIMTAQKHPHWSFRTLQQQFKKHVQRPLQLMRYKNAVLSGTFRDKLNAIKANVYDHFKEARKNKQLVTRRLLQQWAIVAAAQYNNTKQKSEEHINIFRFIVSSTWLTVFLREHRISNHCVVRYIKKKRGDFTRRSVSPDYPDFIINTNQTSCEYRVNVPRTYTHTGEKLVQLYICDLNKVSHTAQYLMTKSDKLLNKIFVCLQEFTDSFRMRVQEDVDELLKLYKNIVVLCSKSGKLTTSLYEQYLKSVVEPYIGNNPFLFIVDFWGGQKNIQIYNEIFRDENNKPTCKYATNTRAVAIRIQSLTHYLLSAPRFKCMLQYA